MERFYNQLPKIQAALFYGGLAFTTLGATSEVVSEIKTQSQLVRTFPDLVSPTDYHSAMLRYQHYASTINRLERTNHPTAAAEIRTSPDYTQSVTVIQNYDHQQDERIKIAEKTTSLMSQKNAILSIIFGLGVSYTMAIVSAADLVIEKLNTLKSRLPKFR